MLYKFEKVVDGLTRYIDSEVITGMNDFQEFIARIAIGRVINNEKTIKDALANNGIIRTFGLIDKAPLQVGTGAVLCMAEQFGAFDRENLIVPVWMI